jgi:hypothetical protein
MMRWVAAATQDCREKSQLARYFWSTDASVAFVHPIVQTARANTTRASML